ncbi:MAG: chemotaxis-specific protein-glutamate methyltransferase CheB [Paludibacter sp.]
MKNLKIKVLIVEDSLVAQKLLKTLVMSDERFELVGVAENGKQACEFVLKHKPDVVSMDILMPIMDGVEATRKIMQETPIPIVIVSSYYQSSEVETAMRVLQAGAVSIIPRPYGPGHSKYEQSTRQYLNTLKMMSEISVVKRRKEETLKPIQKVENITKNCTNAPNNQEFKVLAIGASAGGPEGLSTILSGLPINFPVPVFIVQHIDGNFADGFAVWLNSSTQLPVSIAVNGEKALAGHVYLPPGNQHLTVNKDGNINTTKDGLVNGSRPSVDVLFNSIAEVYGKKSLAVLLSGMGKDGAAELKKLFDLGAFTIAQDENSCLVYGMPGEAAKMGGVCKLLSPEKILQEINCLIKN